MIALGDGRINPFCTSYSSGEGAPPNMLRRASTAPLHGLSFGAGGSKGMCSPAHALILASRDCSASCLAVALFDHGPWRPASPSLPGQQRLSRQSHIRTDCRTPPARLPPRAGGLADFGAPFAGHERIRSPMRNTDLAVTHTSLREHYASSYNRVGE